MSSPVADATAFAERITTETMRTAMSERWKAPEYAILWEVGDATGSRHSRWADAIVMGLWPSRGIDMQGIEIKASRSDWKRELADPSKAEQIARYCDFWWVHAAKGIVQPEELPKGWGLREYDGKRWRTVVEADRRVPEQMTREFLAALLRRADQQVTKEAKRHADAMLAEERASIERRIQESVAMRTQRSAAALGVAEEFEAATGMDLREIARNGEAAAAARITAAIMKAGLSATWFGLDGLVRSLRTVAESTASVMEEIGLEAPKPSQIENVGRRKKA